MEAAADLVDQTLCWKNNNNNNKFRREGEGEGEESKVVELFKLERLLSRPSPSSEAYVGCGTTVGWTRRCC